MKEICKRKYIKILHQKNCPNSALNNSETSTIKGTPFDLRSEKRSAHGSLSAYRMMKPAEVNIYFNFLLVLYSDSSQKLIENWLISSSKNKLLINWGTWRTSFNENLFLWLQIQIHVFYRVQLYFANLSFQALWQNRGQHLFFPGLRKEAHQRTLCQKRNENLHLKQSCINRGIKNDIWCM